MAEVSLQKRQLIRNAGRNVFIAVSAASVVVGSCAVGLYFLWQEMLFQGKVIGEKQKVIDVLGDDTKGNIKAIVDLRTNIENLYANESLGKLTDGKFDKDRWRTIGDMLPLPNEEGLLNLALTSGSIVRLATVPGLNLERLTLPDASTISPLGAGDVTVISADFTITGTKDNILKSLYQIERSVRQLDITSMKWTYSSDQKISLNASANIYFTSNMTIELVDKVIVSDSAVSGSAGGTNQ